MSVYTVTLRGIAEQTVYVEADSPSDARRKAGYGMFFDAADYPDFVEFWTAKRPVEFDRDEIGEMGP